MGKELRLMLAAFFQGCIATEFGGLKNLSRLQSLMERLAQAKKLHFGRRNRYRGARWPPATPDREDRSKPVPQGVPEIKM
jgi:hypothetical protein